MTLPVANWCGSMSGEDLVAEAVADRLVRGGVVVGAPRASQRMRVRVAYRPRDAIGAAISRRDMVCCIQPVRIHVEIADGPSINDNT